MAQIFEYLIHFDQHLSELANSRDWWWPYLWLFLVVFAETGLVILPFLPGDTLLFAAGAVAAGGNLNIWMLMSVLSLAAIIGDSTNYGIGSLFRRHIAQGKRISLFSPETLEKASAFFKKYGGRAVMVGRFVPLVRTAVPFVAGVGAMPYRRFLAFSVLGSVVWVPTFCGLGFLLGNVPIVKNNYHWVMLGAVALILIPMLFKLVAMWFVGKKASRAGTPATTAAGGNATPTA